ncbi:RNA polymerase factor sigma-54 [Chitinibacter fontanus]|uniref:RNA polymerase sigma-54 factor n=1 Tax=Chitinibacter fontanus TaxID=1737446 RepID=A0A7D5V898_9NEIS|nr:RNA polymerase factor sigma-54 [Chitinibacter fontanus]QLI80474.1 RNA polymerase factor sigma-54 [Chitinibacter fontanus]
MKQSLQLRMSQQLNLTPQLQQSIKLLQLSTLDFNQEVEQYLADNPLLEREESAGDSPDSLEVAAPETTDSSTDHVDDLDGLRWDEVKNGGSYDEDDEHDPTLRVAIELSLRDHLLAQARLMGLSARDHALLALLIEALDEDGLLTQDLEEIFAQLPAEIVQELELEVDELRIAHQYLMQLEPLGVGTRSLSECLLLQLKSAPNTPEYLLARRLIETGLELLAIRDFAKLKKQFQCDDDQLRQAQQIIRALNPRPAANWGADTTRYVVPDVLVQKLRGRWTVRLNQAAQPKIKVNEMYARLLQGEVGDNLASALQEARWLIKSIEQRGSTILRVAQAIVARQQAFFEYGEVAMKPLVLRDIAEELDLHESTISRVTTQKFMLTPRGVLEYKYFFGSHVENDSGGENSATSIKALIKQLVAQENPKKPLSDSAITEELARQGVAVARRTVAKYREALNIAPASQRKSL